MATGLRWTEEQLRAAQKKGAQPLPVKTYPLSVLGDLAPNQATKFRNVKVTDEFGERFDSKKELKRWRELLAMQRAGEITMLAKQVRFSLPGQTIYVADFVWQDRNCTLPIRVEDCKSPATRKLAAYRIKVRLMLEMHALKVEEI